MFTLINTMLGIILFVLLFIIIGIKIIRGINGINSGAIFIVIIVLGLVGMMCALFSILGASKIQAELTEIILEKSKLVETIGRPQNIEKEKTVNIIFLMVGYTTLIFECIVYKIMKRKYKKEQADAKNRWDWNKLSKTIFKVH